PTTTFIPPKNDPNLADKVWKGLEPFRDYGNRPLQAHDINEQHREAAHPKPKKQRGAEDNVRHDWTSNVMRGAAIAGLLGSALDLYRSGAAGVYSKRQHNLRKFAWSMTPLVGPGLNNDIMPFSEKAYKAEEKAAEAALKAGKVVDKSAR